MMNLIHAPLLILSFYTMYITPFIFLICAFIIPDFSILFFILSSVGFGFIIFDSARQFGFLARFEN